MAFTKGQEQCPICEQAPVTVGLEGQGGGAQGEWGGGKGSLSWSHWKSVDLSRQQLAKDV